MSLPLAIEPLPLTTDADGAVRVGGTRVTLDTLVEAFHEGLTAEEMAQPYPSVALADIYAVIGYYLRRRTEVEAYLEERRQKAREVREWNEARTDPRGIRERLLARRQP
jgi:uncharacterized protein (DUF433 family)